MTFILRTILMILVVTFFLPSIASAGFVETPGTQRRLIVFVHGLGNSGGNDARMAWSNSSPENSWPEILNDDPAIKRNFAIYMAQYGTAHFSGNFQIQGLSLELSGILKDVIDDYDQVFFVVHSLGGIVVRNLLIEDITIRNKTGGIFLFASPMGGSQLAKLAKTLGIASIQTAQLGDGADEPGAVFNTLKDSWFREKIDIPSYCAYETEKSGWWLASSIVVTRSSLEPLCNQAVVPLRGAHTAIVQPPEEGEFFGANFLLKEWLGELVPDYVEGADVPESENQTVIANCSGNFAYRGPYGSVHSLLKALLKANGVENARYSLPLSQIWAGDGSLSQFFAKYPPSDVVIHLSCFQNVKEDTTQSVLQRDRNFVALLKSFKNYKTNFIVYSRAFAANGCHFIYRKMEEAEKSGQLVKSYKDRLKLIAVGPDEMPGDRSSADQTIVAALSANRVEGGGRFNNQECFVKRKKD